jgi:hypothetical protein
MDPLGTDSCRGTVPMEPPSNGSMRYQNPDSDFDDTLVILQAGASCTIAAQYIRIFVRMKIRDTYFPATTSRAWDG